VTVWRHCVRWGPISPSQKGHSPRPIFGPCLSWQNGWMDQDATWYGGRPRPRRRCVRWGPSSAPPPKRCTAPIFAHLYCGQTAGWMKTALGTEVGPGVHIVLDGDRALPAKDAQQTPVFGLVYCVHGRSSQLLLNCGNVIPLITQSFKMFTFYICICLFIMSVMAAVCSRCGQYIFVLLLSFFFSSPNLNRRRLDLYHTSTHGVALVRTSNAGLKCAARGSLEMQDPKNRQKFAIWAPSHNFVGLYLRN